MKKKNGMTKKCYRAFAIATLAVGASGTLSISAQAQVSQSDSPELATELTTVEQEVLDSAAESTALALAQRQVGQNDLSGAATTLERYLIADPESVAARTEYAITLCRLDDKQAGRFEAQKLQAAAPDQDLTDRISIACADQKSATPAS